MSPARVCRDLEDDGEPWFFDFYETIQKLWRWSRSSKKKIFAPVNNREIPGCAEDYNDIMINIAPFRRQVFMLHQHSLCRICPAGWYRTVHRSLSNPINIEIQISIFFVFAACAPVCSNLLWYNYRQNI